MLKTYRSLNKKIGRTIILLIVSFLFILPQMIKAVNSVEVTGSIQVKTDSSITVNSILFLVNSSTRITGSMNSTISFDSLQTGSLVKIVAESKSSGTLVADNIQLMSTRINLDFSGKITAISGNSLTVEGTQILVDTNTVIFTQFHASLLFSNLKVGDNVTVKTAQTIGGQLTAVAIIVMTQNSRQEIELEGKIEALTSNSIKILNVLFSVDSRTIILAEHKGIIQLSDLKMGDNVSIRGFMQQDSTYLALNIRLENEDYDRTKLQIEGAVNAVTSNSITVNMTTCKVDSSTVIYSHDGVILKLSNLKVGDMVEVKAVLQSDNSYYAARIELQNQDSEKDLEVAGLIDVVNVDNISVGGYTVYINSQTKIYNQFKQSLAFSDLKTGTMVVVKAIMQNNIFYASTIKVNVNNSNELNITGAIEALSGSTLTVSGVLFLTDQNTDFVDNNMNTVTYNDLKIGQIVSIKAVLQSGQYYALRVKTKDFWSPAVIVEGTIENLTINSITVLGKTFTVNSSTLVISHGVTTITFGNLTLGMKVEVKGSLSAGGILTAKLIKIHPAQEYDVYGKINSLSGTQLVVAGLTIKIDQNTLYYDEYDKVITIDSLKVNQFVEVAYVKTVLNDNLAVKVEVENDPHTVQYDGVVTVVNQGNITLNTPSFGVNSNTVFISSAYLPIQSSAIQAGQTIKVWAAPDQNGNLNATQVQQISSTVVSISDGGNSKLPVNYELKQNYPNPFNPSTVISFTLAKQEEVKLTVYNILGEEITTLISSPMEAGVHVVRFNGANLTSGVYLYRLKAGSFISTKKMILLK